MTKLEHAQAPNNKESHLVKRFVAGGALVAAAIAGGMYEAGEFDRADKAEAASSLSHPGNSMASPEAHAKTLGNINLGMHLSKNQIIALENSADAQSIAPADLVAAFGSDFDSWRNQVFNTISPVLSADQAAVLNKDTLPSMNNEKRNWSDQEVLNALAVDIADATIQQTQQEGHVMLPTVLDAHSHGFQSVYDGIEGGQSPSATLQIYKVLELPRHKQPQGEFMGITGLSPNVRLIFATYQHDKAGDDASSTPTVAILADLRKGPNANDPELWRKLDFWDVHDTQFQSATSSLMN